MAFFVEAHRLVRAPERWELEARCPKCSDLVRVDPFEIYATCRCGADLELDAGAVLPMGTS